MSSVGPSSPQFPDIDFRQIRPYGQPASRANGFEELASILIRQGVVAWPEDVTFYRFGNPDGGREGKGVLANGDVWAWQAKFLFEFDDSAVTQVSNSIERALELEPNLKKYYVALPVDLPAGDTEGTKRTLKSAQTRWDQKQKEWENAAKGKGLDVEFFYIGAHLLLTALTEPQNAGRTRYWFDTGLLTPEQQHQRLEEVVAKAGRRYTPKLHVDVETVRALDALGRTDSYVRRWQDALASLRKSRQYGWRAPKGDEDAFSEALGQCVTALDAAEVSLGSMIVAAGSTGPLPDILATLEQAQEPLRVVARILRDRHLKDGKYYVDEAGSLYGNVTDARNALWTGADLFSGEETSAAQAGALLLTGRAGVGKTHLFCDVASKRLDAGRPTVIVLGQDFDNRPLLPQIGELVELEGALDDVLELLDAASEADECIGLLMVDAVNEGEKAERWKDDLRVLTTKVARYRHVALAVSCRTEFLQPVIGDDAGLPRVEHPGFAEATSEAIDRYANEYQIERPAFPVLNPEFSNPLFLKLACEALTTLGQNRFTFGSAGLLTVCTAFMEAVNKRLASPSRCDYDETTNPVADGVRQLALTGPGPYERADAQRITKNILPDRPWSRSLLHGLLREGVLMETYGNRLAFGYQRLGDVLRASALADKTLEELTAWLNELDTNHWQENGVIGALSVIAPERFDAEIVDLLADDEGMIPGYAIDAFLESLVLRAPDHITDRSVEIVHSLVANEYWADQTWDKLIRVACIPDHALNAEWLHTNLDARPLAERDQTWSEWLIGTTGDHSETSISMLLDWAWPPRPFPGAILPDDVATLTTLALGWLLTTPDRRVRDRATKALVSVADRAPAGFAAALQRFQSCDDPYVIERLGAAACGAVLRTTDPAVITRIADAAGVLVADEWPTHLLTRDYLRRVSAAARESGWTGPAWQPPYGAQWPVPSPRIDEIEELAGPPDYTYSSIWSSLTGHLGDFGRYVLQPALDDIASDDENELRSQAERAIFARCLNLGWTPERFGHLDRERGGDGKVERYGKKYQWIGLYETLGRITDHHQLQERWTSRDPVNYMYPEQLIYRDIDPSVLVQLKAEPTQNPRWFVPATATFPTDVVNDYPADLDDIPDPLKLLAVTAPDDSKWLSLILHASWNQELPPEITALRAPNLNAWIQIRGYLAPLTDVDAIKQWAAGKDWDGHWMPENAEVHSRLLGAHPASPDWDWADGNSEPRGPHDQPMPTEFTQCVGWYGGTGTSRESTGLGEPTGYVPSRRLYDLLELQRGLDFTWANPAGVAVYSPSNQLHEPQTCLMRRDLSQHLANAGFTLFWTVLLNKQRHDHDYGRPDDDYRWISASASYILSGGAVERIDAIATIRSAGPHGRRTAIPWRIRTTD
jgi:hypothetical protein